VKITSVWKRQNTNESEIRITSPFQASKSYQTVSNQSAAPCASKHKTQLKLNKMNNFIKKASSKENILSESSSDDVRVVEARPAERREAAKEHQNPLAEAATEPIKTSWKIKAIIDNRNFLIPIAYALLAKKTYCKIKKILCLFPGTSTQPLTI